MKNSNNNNNKDDYQDKAIDALLREDARISEANDQAFLDEIEKSLDQIDQQKILPIGDEIVDRSIASNASKKYWVPTALAACAVDALILGWTINKRQDQYIVASNKSKNETGPSKAGYDNPFFHMEGKDNSSIELSDQYDPFADETSIETDLLASNQTQSSPNDGAEVLIAGPRHQAIEESLSGLVVQREKVNPAKVPNLKNRSQLSFAKVASDYTTPFEPPHRCFPIPGHPIDPDNNRENYGKLIDNSFQNPSDHPLSTFSIDVDTASYTNIRRMIQSRSQHGFGEISPDSVRIEEMINYFDYNYPQPESEHPFSVSVTASDSPWNTSSRLLRIGLQALDIEQENRPSVNLVFLLDISGSMNTPKKLPLVKHAMKTMVEGLNRDDVVSIVVYAGSRGIALQPTDGSQKETIKNALEKLRAGGSTNGAGGIKLAYEIAQKQFVEGGVNRVVLCTDGDFNVGLSNQDQLVDLVKQKAQDGVYLTVCGMGTGNLNDAMLEGITNEGNGNYYYIDNKIEAEKIFGKELSGTLVTIAKDVKIQVEFNPEMVKEYRLIGYANRMLKAEDFNNDKVDAGEIGAGHSVTALYEIVPTYASNVPSDIELKYQNPKKETKNEIDPNQEMATIKLRYKKPDQDKSQLLEVPFVDPRTTLEKSDQDTKFSVAVAAFGELLRGNKHLGTLSTQKIIELAKIAISEDNNDEKIRREEFVELVRQYEKKN